MLYIDGDGREVAIRTWREYRRETVVYEVDDFGRMRAEREIRDGSGNVVERAVLEPERGWIAVLQSA
jgi:hypothetical protein